MEYNEKTIFILNHTNSFNELSRDEIPLESGNKSAIKAIFRKSFWSNTVDAVLQYSRVVFDIFSQEKPISIVTFDREEKIHTIWLGEDQSVEALWSVFTQEGPPSASVIDQSCSSFMPGLDAACSMLLMLKNPQENDSPGTNTGRVIFITRNSRGYIDSWIPMILSALAKPIKSSDCCPVTASEWLFIDLTTSADAAFAIPELIEIPSTAPSTCPHRFLYLQLPSNGVDLCRGLMRLVEAHYNLASTLVQDIPMKEEANTSSSSTMYGVELLHQAEAHAMLQRVGLADRLIIRSEDVCGESEVTFMPQKPNSGFSRTLGIKWVTPKSADTAQLRYASAAFRVTLADIGNRASVCLAQFVLGGRSVALAHRLPTELSALPADSDRRQLFNTSEALLLTCHGSVMYLHVLATICPLAHPLPIGIHEYPNKSDLRSKAFIDQIIRPSRLAPASARQSFSVFPRERAQIHLERSTRYWPLLESSTLLGANKLAAPLFEHLPKEYLEAGEVLACKAAVDRFVELIKQNVSLADTRKAPGKRPASSIPVAPTVQAEAVALALEVDHLLESYADLSIEHQEVQQHWRSATRISTNTSHIRTQLTTSEQVCSMELGELIRLARASISQGPQSTVSLLPDAFMKALRGLKEVCETINKSKRSTKTGSAYQSKMDHSNSDQIPVFEPVSLSLFMNSLQPTKGGKMRRDFAGVSTADSKGVCQLYRSLREKEQERIAT